MKTVRINKFTYPSKGFHSALIESRYLARLDLIKHFLYKSTYEKAIVFTSENISPYHKQNNIDIYEEYDPNILSETIKECTYIRSRDKEKYIGDCSIITLVIFDVMSPFFLKKKEIQHLVQTSRHYSISCIIINDRYDVPSCLLANFNYIFLEYTTEKLIQKLYRHFNNGFHCFKDFKDIVNILTKQDKLVVIDSTKYQEENISYYKINTIKKWESLIYKLKIRQILFKYNIYQDIVYMILSSLKYN